MGRYLLFAGDEYYPAGGWQDYRGRFNSLNEAIKAAAKLTWDWWQIVNLETGKIILEEIKR